MWTHVLSIAMLLLSTASTTTRMNSGEKPNPYLVGLPLRFETWKASNFAIFWFSKIANQSSMQRQNFSKEFWTYVSHLLKKKMTRLLFWSIFLPESRSDISHFHNGGLMPCKIFTVYAQRTISACLVDKRKDCSFESQIPLHMSDLPGPGRQPYRKIRCSQRISRPLPLRPRILDSALLCDHFNKA